MAPTGHSIFTAREARPLPRQRKGPGSTAKRVAWWHFPLGDATTATALCSEEKGGEREENAARAPAWENS